MTRKLKINFEYAQAKYVGVAQSAGRKNIVSFVAVFYPEQNLERSRIIEISARDSNRKKIIWQERIEPFLGKTVEPELAQTIGEAIEACSL